MIALTVCMFIFRWSSHSYGPQWGRSSCISIDGTCSTEISSHNPPTTQVHHGFRAQPLGQLYKPWHDAKSLRRAVFGTRCCDHERQRIQRGGEVDSRLRSATYAGTGAQFHVSVAPKWHFIVMHRKETASFQPHRGSHQSKDQQVCVAPEFRNLCLININVASGCFVPVSLYNSVKTCICSKLISCVPEKMCVNFALYIVLIIIL